MFIFCIIIIINFSLSNELFNEVTYIIYYFSKIKSLDMASEVLMYVHSRSSELFDTKHCIQSKKNWRPWALTLQGVSEDNPGMLKVCFSTTFTYECCF